MLSFAVVIIEGDLQREEERGGADRGRGKGETATETMEEGGVQVVVEEEAERGGGVDPRPHSRIGIEKDHLVAVEDPKLRPCISESIIMSCK